MFVSKISSLVRNSFIKTYNNVSVASAVQGRFSSTTASTTNPETPPPNIESNETVGQTNQRSDELPDKLYREIEIEVRGNDSKVLESYGVYAESAAKQLGITMIRNFAPKKPDHDRWTVLKSAHVYKKHRVQYEFRTHYRFLNIIHLTGSTADTYLEYIQRNLPEGVAMKVTKYELQLLPPQILNS